MNQMSLFRSCVRVVRIIKLVPQFTEIGTCALKKQVFGSQFAFLLHRLMSRFRTSFNSEKFPKKVAKPQKRAWLSLIREPPEALVRTK